MGKHQYENEGSYRKQNYNQHDDRSGSRPPSIRGGGGGGRPSINRVWRKGDGKTGPNQGGQTKRGRHVSFNERSGGISRGGIHKRLRGGPSGGGALRNIALDDDDASMRGPSGGAQAGRARPAYGSRGGGRGRGRGGRGRGVSVSGGVYVRRSDADASGWHKVTLLNASRYPKEEVLAALVGAHAAVAPLCFAKNGMNYVFYVETRQQANALAALDKQIRLQDGSTLNVRADPSPPPTMVINDDAIERIKTVMSQRYNPANKALDMKSFHSDRSFLGESVYAPLSRALCMKKVVQIINENIPEVEAIDFSDNRLQDMTTFAMNYVSKSLKILYLANNKLTEAKDLICLKDYGFKGLEVLKVDGNPFVSKYVDHEHLSRNMRKIFPSLKILNDKEMPKVIGFEGDDEDTSGGMTPLPPIQMKMTCNQTVEPVILQFLQEYFKVYDSGNREPLMNAYHEEAVMSLHAAYLPTGRRKDDNEQLGEYFARSRNLFRLTDPIKRKSFLKTGRLAITSFISELPKTEHDFNSFTLDVPLADSNAGLMQFTVTGVFRETEQSSTPVIRHFSRTFLVVPQGAGFCIVNETLFVTNSTSLSMKKAFTGESAAAASASASTAAASASAAGQPDANTVRSMVAMMAQKSGMNDEWSKRCLQETNWNLEAAFEAFQRASNEGKIPISAYEK